MPAKKTGINYGTGIAYGPDEEEEEEEEEEYLSDLEQYFAQWFGD